MWWLLDRLGARLIPTARTQAAAAQTLVTPERKRARDRLGTRIVYGALLALALVLLGNDTWQRTFWTPVDAGVTGTTERRRDVEISFRFTTREHETVHGTAVVGRRIARQIGAARRVTVLYAPSNARRTVLAAQQAEQRGFGLCLLLLSGVVLALSYWRQRRQPAAPLSGVAYP